MVVAFNTSGWNGYSVKFLKSSLNTIAFTANQQFGISGLGRVYVGECDGRGSGVLLGAYTWSDALFDVCQLHVHTNTISPATLLLTTAGDGTVQLWSFHSNHDNNFAEAGVNIDSPTSLFTEHLKEVYGVDSNEHASCCNLFLTGSWDNTVKLWDVHRLQSLSTYTHHSAYVYCVVWAKQQPHLFCSAAGDGTVSLCDSRLADSGSSVRKFARADVVSSSEVLSCDISTQSGNYVVSGSTDASICVWDVRGSSSAPVNVLIAHDKAVRRCKFVPGSDTLIVSCSYDYTVRTWDHSMSKLPLESTEHHTEFVYGLDVDRTAMQPTQIADYSWDCNLCIYAPASLRH